jgi:hypothetical protein
MGRRVRSARPDRDPGVPTHLDALLRDEDDDVTAADADGR